MTHDAIQADLSSFALGALDAGERRAVEAHLTGGCAACQRELATWQEVVGSLALAGEAAGAPHLKPALLQRVRPAPRRAKVIALPRWSLVPLAAAAVALLVLGAVREAGLRNELGVAHQELEHVAQQLALKEKDVAALRAALASAEESLAIVQKPGLQLVRLTETPKSQPAEGPRAEAPRAEAPRAEAHVLISPDTRRALFYAFDLPAVPADKAYELWWITEKEGPVSAGVFVPDRRGLGRIQAAVPAEAGAIQAAAVTIEPHGGLPKPTGPMVLLGKL